MSLRKERFDLQGKTAIVTGAAQGIGRCLAEVLLEKGCRLALVDINAEALEIARAELAERTPDRRITTHVVDVSDREQMRVLAPQVARMHPQLHILINNAGVGYEAMFPQCSLETWDHVMGVNLWGVIHGCHFFMPYLAKAPRAHIVNMSSLFGNVGMAGQTVYCTTKYGVKGLSECLWEELRTTTIGLTVAHPGSVRTDIMRRSGGDDPELMEYLASWYDDHAYPPRRAAEKIVAAIERDKRRVLITLDSALIDVVKRMIPVWGNRLVGDVILRVLKLGHMREVRRLQWEKTMVEGDGSE